MPTPPRARRRLLRQAVQANVELVQGLPPRSLRGNARWRRIAFRGGMVVAGAVAVALLAGLLAVGFGPPMGAERVSALVPGVVSAGWLMQAPELPPVAIHDPGAEMDPAALSLEVQRIVLDPGHGGRDRGTSRPGGLVEKEVTLDLALRLADKLQVAGFEPVLTRATDRSLSLRDRTRLANEAAGDLFVSIHLNWFEHRRPCGLETYYLGPGDDPEVTRLAAVENGASGYSVADVRRLLDGIYSDFRQAESQRLAAAVQSSLLESLRRFNPALEDRGVRSAPFLVLVGAQMPAILAEVSCLSSPEEGQLLHEDAYRQEIAAALYRGLVSHAVRGMNNAIN